MTTITSSSFTFFFKKLDIENKKALDNIISKSGYKDLYDFFQYPMSKEDLDSMGLNIFQRNKIMKTIKDSQNNLFHWIRMLPGVIEKGEEEEDDLESMMSRPITAETSK